MPFSDFSYSFQTCYFVAGEIDAEHCTYYEDTDVPPNIMWGSFSHESKQLNGIVIDYAGNSCELETMDGKKVIKEIQRSANEFGRGFDVIRDDYLTRSNLSFVLDLGKAELNKTSPIMSTGSNVFIKGAKNKFVHFDPRGNNETFNGDYHAIIDDSFIKLL
uniref:Uncharacterized protein n=1 Tax=Panagrolaimus sp. JU765 TaxID=591449 RepID=A0AC34Q3R5_9BILA